MRLAGIQQVLRAAVIVIQHEAPVVLHGVGTGALVEDRLDLAQLTSDKTLVKLVLVEVIAELGAEQVAILRAIGEVIDGNDVVHANGIQSMHQVAANHTGSAGHHDSHGNNSS